MEEDVSPRPPVQEVEAVQTNLLGFPDAIAAVGLGKTIGKEEWDIEEGYFAKLLDGRVKIHNPNGNFYDWILSDADLQGEDYYIIEDK